MFYKLCCVLSGALLLLAAGCSEDAIPDPPVSRSELTARLYDALKFNRDQEALAIIDKLLALAPDDAELMEMRGRVVANECVRKLQVLVDAGKLNDALKLVRETRQKNPHLQRLTMLEEDIVNLIELQVCARNLSTADKIPELTAALEKITPLAAKYPQARLLQRDIAQRRSELLKMRREAAGNQKEKTSPPVTAPQDNSVIGPVKPQAVL